MYIYIYKCLYTHICMHVGLHMDMHAYMHTYTHTHTYTYIHSYMHSCTVAHLHTVHACMRTVYRYTIHIHVCKKSCTYVHTCTQCHTCIYTCIHRCNVIHTSIGLHALHAYRPIRMKVLLKSTDDEAFAKTDHYLNIYFRS